MNIDYIKQLSKKSFIYYSDWLEWNDLKKLVLKLISLKAFQ